MTDRFELSVDQVGYAILFLGVGNLAGSFGGAYVIQKFNRFNTLVAGFLLAILCFIIVPFLPSVAAFDFVYFFIFLNMGIAYPLIMGQLTSLDPTLRGTISSLGNSIMYAATTIGSGIAGVIYATFNGFTGVAIFAALCFAAALFYFISSGILTKQSEMKSKLAS